MIARALSTILPQRRAMAGTPGPDDDFWFQPVGQATTSGITVTPEKSMGVSAVYGCVRLLRESLGSLPWKVYKRTGEKSKETAQDHYLWRVLHDRPNRWQTAMELKEMAVAHLCLRGNFYCEIRGAASYIELLPLSPDRMEVKQRDDYSLEYKYHHAETGVHTYRQEEIFHVRGLSLNGITGVSVLEFARNATGAAIAQEAHGSALFKNGGLPTVWIYRPPEAKWNANARKNFRDSWRSIHGGENNSGNPPILEDGAELRSIDISNRDTQWIEARGFSAEEICRFFGVSPHMVGVKTSAPLGSIEQQSLEFVLYTLGPLAVRFEQAANRDLLADESETHFTKIQLDALLRGDLKSRYEAHNISVQGGWALVNEVRELEDRNPIEGGDEPRYPMNMQPAGGMPDQNEQGGQPGKGTPKQEPREPDARAAFSILLDEAAGRIAAHEIRHIDARVDKADEDPVRFAEYLTELYDKQHLPYAAKVLDPIRASWLAMTGNRTDDERLNEALVLGSNTFAASGWPDLKETRAAQLATLLKEEFFG
jgi:HK97 family phage portal protein